jgi:hypothetical protein
MDLLSSAALAPLTEAAAIVFRLTGSTDAHALVEQFAGALLRARASSGGVSGFFGASSGSVPQAQATAAAGLALVEAYAVTRNPTYRDAALAAAVDVTNPALGWVSSAKEHGVRERPGGPGVNVALTADAALLLKRAAALGDVGLLAQSRAALRTVYSSQAAVGRWYAFVGSHQPMDLSEWGTTLFDLLADGSKESLGIAGGGVPALYDTSFTARGQLMKNSLTDSQPGGVALALRALAAYPDPGLSETAFAALVDLRRHDGTISLARASDTVSQADFALAFAQKAAGPVKGE